MPKKILAIFVLIASWTESVHAWNALGHKVVAEIAWRELTPEHRQLIVDTLRRHPRFDADFAGKMTDDVLRADKATQDHWIFQHAATWPDLARGLPAGARGKYDRPPWHYINLPLYLDASDRRDLAPKLTVNLAAEPADDPRGYNVLQAIAHSRAALVSKVGPEAKAVAFCWHFHLAGDLHQPLHSTALFSVDQFPKGDRGGNSILLVRGRNLHSLWDNLLGRQHYLRNVDREVAELTGLHRDVWESAAMEADPRKWAEESHELCKAVVYSDSILNAIRATPEGAKLMPIQLPETYYRMAGEHARRRIIAAGLRLGALLKDKVAERSD